MFHPTLASRLLGFVRRTPADHRESVFREFFRDRAAGKYVGRFKARDATAIQYRMGAGFAGDVNRTHPFSVEACLVDPTNPPTFYGQAVVPVAASNGVRMIGAGDGALTDIYGVTVRPFPFQASTGGAYGAASIGSATPPTNQPIEILRAGYIMVPIVGVPTKGLPVYVWYAAAAGAHLQGGFEIANTPGSTFLITAPKTTFQGGADSSGIGELAFNA